MSDITVINDTQQSELVTNGLAKNGELYLKADGSTDAGAIVVYDSGSWRTFANEASPSFQNQYSVEFDGTNDFMSVAANSSLDTTGDCSASFWVYLDSTFSYRATVNKRDAGTHNWQCGITGAKISLLLAGAGVTLTGTTTITENAWHHIAFSVDVGATNGAILYLNGSVETTATVSSFNNNGAGFTIGDNTRSRFFDGQIDEVAWFHSALSGSDISSIYNSGVPTDISSYSPVAWWRMGDNDGGTGTTITDQGSGGNDGTLTNGPTFSTSVPS
jgi:hypothetical protein